MNHESHYRNHLKLTVVIFSSIKMSSFLCLFTKEKTADAFNVSTFYDEKIQIFVGNSFGFDFFIILFSGFPVCFYILK